MSVWREVQEEIYSCWRAGWVTDGPGPVALTPYCFANEKFDPPNGPWARVSAQRIAGGPGTLGSPGNRKMDRRGRLFIQLFEPPLGGVGNLSDLAEKAAQIFENRRILAVHDIRFAEVEPGPGLDVEEGRWFGIVVEGAFDYEEHR